MGARRAVTTVVLAGALAVGTLTSTPSGAATAVRWVPASAVPASAAQRPAGVSSAVLRVKLGKGSALAPHSRIAGFHTLNACTRDYYLIRSWMERLEAKGGGVVTLAPGTYLIPKTIYVPARTTIVLSAGTKLVKSTRTCVKGFRASSSMFMLVPPSKGHRRGSVGQYAGASDISILGAGDGRSVIDLAGVRNALAIVAGHNRRVRIEGIRFQDMNNNHFIEMDANADSVIRGNEFRGATPDTRLSAEAINLDTPDRLTNGFAAKWSTLDGTANVHVLIEGNAFVNLVRGVGTHNFTRGRFHTDIVVRNNTFSHLRNDAIRVMNWRNGVITGNRLDSVWCPERGNKCRGILASGAVNPTFRGNTFAHMARGIQFMPWQNSEAASVYGITYNVLSAANLADLASNTAGPGLLRPEAIINPRFGVFSHPRIIRFAGT